MYQSLGNFLEALAHRAPNMRRPFNSFWEAIGRPDRNKQDPQPPEPPSEK
jgi:hypothetical protein